jgi:hypothetical protein
MNENQNENQNYENKELGHLNDIILTLNDQLGILGNNLIQVNAELDYLKQEYKKLLEINKEMRQWRQTIQTKEKMGLIKF